MFVGVDSDHSYCVCVDVGGYVYVNECYVVLNVNE